MNVMNAETDKTIQDAARISLFEHICRIISESKSPRQTLDAIVKQVAERCGIDVCSVYLFDESKTHIVLTSTFGLNPSSTEMIRMRTGEGLSGLAIESRQPVFVRNPAAHPRYKYFEGSGEEAYRTFLGIPLVYYREYLGVFVIQTVEPDGVSESDIPVFVAIAGQIAAAAAYSGLIESLKREKRLSEPYPEDQKIFADGDETGVQNKMLFRGVPASAGVGEGFVHFLSESIGFDQITALKTDHIEHELARFESALKASEKEIQTVIDRMSAMSEAEKAILETHLLLVRDQSIINKVKKRIQSGDRVEYALKCVIMNYLAWFESMENPYLKERASDIEDIGKRVLRNLFGIEAKIKQDFSRETIIVASDISPVELMALIHPNLKGIVLSKGGRTSHTVILAKSFETPAVIGLKDAVDALRENEFVIIDGTSGLVFRKPAQAVIDEYAHLKAAKEKQRLEFEGIRNLPATTADGVTLRLGANIGLLSDLELVQKYGADHIGLYRTEFPFLARKAFPSEDEQVELYTKMIEGSGGRSLTIRTLDVGGDKFLSYLDNPKENNPYLGWRSIRVSLELDDIFRTQIRAVLRASAFGRLRLLIPMITYVEEAREIIRIVSEEKQLLTQKGLKFDNAIPIGLMVEVPGAVRILKYLLNYVDFVSVGTNDLIQYTLAVDRNNEKVARLYNPLHPAVIETVLEIVNICRNRKKSVSICGEAASNPACAYLFLAMQPDRLSMNPPSIPVIKQLIRKTVFKDAEHALHAVLKMEDAESISCYLSERLGDMF